MEKNKSENLGQKRLEEINNGLKDLKKGFDKIDKNRELEKQYTPLFELVKAKQPLWKRICIAVPTTGLVRIEWVLARFGQIIPCNWSHSDIFQFYNMFSPLQYVVADARNVCVSHSLGNNYEWTLFIDHDVCLPSDCFLRINEYMRNADVPIVSGLYYAKGNMPEPLIYRGDGNSFYEDWKFGDKVWCSGIPMGLTLINNKILKVLYDEAETYVTSTLLGPATVRRVFDTPKLNNFDLEKQAYSSRTGTEDLDFCNNVIEKKVFERAGFKKYQKMKYPFLCDTNLFGQHIDEGGRKFPGNLSIYKQFKGSKFEKLGRKYG